MIKIDEWDTIQCHLNSDVLETHEKLELKTYYSQIRNTWWLYEDQNRDLVGDKAREVHFIALTWISR